MERPVISVFVEALSLSPPSLSHHLHGIGEPKGLGNAKDMILINHYSLNYSYPTNYISTPSFSIKNDSKIINFKTTLNQPLYLELFLPN